ncbi:MAG: hypothetical protein JWN52_3268 [Actinomycetia bacterium]|nr:hypothetical protein [Actinomycetes bacterium]
MEASGKRREAERELLNRQNCIEDMDIRPLDPAARDTYHAEWARVQERFVDTPEDALSDADQLVRRVMTGRGYETQGYQQRVADLSVDHARTLEHYRTAHDISARAASKEASTEELRQAMIHYRTLFEDLLGGSSGGTARAITETEGDPQYRTAADHPGGPREG